MEHARHVVDLWTRQIGALEKALEQLNEVDRSRSVLQVEYQGVKGSASVLEAPVAMRDVPQRGRRPKSAGKAAKTDVLAPGANIARKRSSKLAERLTTHADKISEGKVGKSAKPAKKTVGKKSVNLATAKYKDPNSDRTWAGKGRLPIWLQGDRAQYEIGKQSAIGTEDMPSGAAVYGSKSPPAA